MVNELTSRWGTERRDRSQFTDSTSYWYVGKCPKTHRYLRLPRNAEIEAIARQLMQDLASEPCYQQEGKMYGVLLAETPSGTFRVLKAFSGMLQGQSMVEGWVPPIPGRGQVALAEAHTLQQLDALKAHIVCLKELPERSRYRHLQDNYAEKLQMLTDQHRQRKQSRDRQREQARKTLTGQHLAIALEALNRQSQQDGIERRRLKRERDQVLQPLAAAIAQADQEICKLKHQRRQLSRQLQAEMHAVYSLTNFAGNTAALADLFQAGLPTGTGDCAAPKLLHHAATHGLRPLAMAEFWWGPASQDRQPGQFYGACAERCQPIMGFLLSGLPASVSSDADVSTPLPILYEDDGLLIVNKPTGLLSVPGRTSDLQDSVLSRLRCQRLECGFLKAAHRLDKGTSGILVLAKSALAHRQLSQQFASQQVSKRYEAILSRSVKEPSGVISLPLWPDPSDRPKQMVHYQNGKPSLTEFDVITQSATPRVRFIPHTGRTHQLRVHAAHRDGLDAPILGDSLYGEGLAADRLHLHATSIKFTHPDSQQPIEIVTPAPF